PRQESSLRRQALRLGAIGSVEHVRDFLHGRLSTRCDEPKQDARLHQRRAEHGSVPCRCGAYRPIRCQHLGSISASESPLFVIARLAGRTADSPDHAVSLHASEHSASDSPYAAAPLPGASPACGPVSPLSNPSSATIRPPPCRRVRCPPDRASS